MYSYCYPDYSYYPDYLQTLASDPAHISYIVMAASSRSTATSSTRSVSLPRKSSTTRLPQLLRVLHLLRQRARHHRHHSRPRQQQPATTAATTARNKAVLAATTALRYRNTDAFRNSHPRQIYPYIFLFELSQQDQKKKASPSTRSPEATQRHRRQRLHQTYGQRQFHHSLDQLGTSRAFQQCLTPGCV